jgi:hypothetical protein
MQVVSRGEVFSTKVLSALLAFKRIHSSPSSNTQWNNNHKKRVFFTLSLMILFDICILIIKIMRRDPRLKAQKRSK